MREPDFQAVRQVIDAVREVEDPMERVKVAHDAHNQMRAFQAEFAQIRREAIDDLVRNDVKQKAIAEALGMTQARLSQLAKSGPGPERALLAPKASLRTAVTVAVVRKREDQKRRGSVVDTTFDATLKLQSLAHRWEMETKTEKIPDGGFVDLNRDHLIVMIGPRITPLVAQAISADPVIKWRQDDSGHWYMTDINTGLEYHSDFDHNAGGETEGDLQTCYAHVGRIRRPDGEGSFLYLGGIHAPGTAGAVEVLCNEIGTIWEKAHRNLWSAVVKTTARADETLVAAEIITPVYTHGKSR